MVFKKITAAVSALVLTAGMATALPKNASVPMVKANAASAYNYKAVEKNIETLKSYGYEIVDARPGLLACGVVGDGCLADNETILEAIKNHLK